MQIENIRLIAPYTVEGITSSSFTELQEYLKTAKIITVDCETRAKQEYAFEKKAALDPYKSEIVMLQIGDANVQYVIDTRPNWLVTLNYNTILKSLRSPNITKLGVNLKFDYKQLKVNWGVEMTNMIDIMLNERVLYCNKTNEDNYFSLAGMANRYLGINFLESSEQSLFPELTYSKEVRKDFYNIGEEPFTKLQIIYGANDVWMPIKIWEKQQKELKNQGYVGDLSADKLENRFMPVLANIELAGMYLDPDMWVSNLEKYEELLEKKEKYLSSIHDINWNSSKQVTEVFKARKIPTKIIDKDKSYGDNLIYKDTVSVTHIKKFEKKWPIISEYLEYKQLKKLTTSYGEKFLQHVHPETGRVHSNFFQILKTGRISSNSPNIQQIPNSEKREGFRECFIPAPGNSYVIADYSGQESRILADVANENVMIDFFKNGDGDLHSLTGSRMFGVPVSKSVNSKFRHIGKILNFSIAYGASAHKLADAFQISIKEAEDFIRRFYKAYPNLLPYFKEEQEKAKKNGYILIDPFTKRRSWIPFYEEFKRINNFVVTRKLRGQTDLIPKSIWSKYYRYKGEIERDAQNFKIQGTGASMTKLAAILFRDWKKANDIPANIIALVHDEIVVECKQEIAEKVSSKLRSCMEEAGKAFMITSEVQIIAKPIIAQYWAH